MSAAPANAPAMEKPLAGFEDVFRFWDRKHLMWGAKIKPGEYFVTKCEEVVVTVLGSCIAACIRDKKTGFGGMNHFMLPASRAEPIGGGVASDATRYGNFAMEHLINDVLKLGAKRHDLEVKIFGGGRIMSMVTNVGQSNIEFVHDYLKQEGIEIAAECTGDSTPRKLIYFPRTGKALVKKMRNAGEVLAAEERNYKQKIEAKPVQGEIELF